MYYRSWCSHNRNRHICAPCAYATHNLANYNRHRSSHACVIRRSVRTLPLALVHVIASYLNNGRRRD